MYVIVVDFEVEPGRQGEFLALMNENAAASLADEPGCLQFDVCVGEPGQIFLYEIYRDVAAFREHAQTAHFRRFDEASRAMVKSKSVRSFERVWPAHA